MEFKYKVSAALFLGALVGMAVYLLVNGDVSTAAGQVPACFPPNASVCAGCTAV